MLCKQMNESGTFRNRGQIGILRGKYDVYLIFFAQFIGFDCQPDRIRPIKIYLGPDFKKGFLMINLSILILYHPVP